MLGVVSTGGLRLCVCMSRFGCRYVVQLAIFKWHSRSAAWFHGVLRVHTDRRWILLST
jgi:hypothetical protein